MRVLVSLVIFAFLTYGKGALASSRKPNFVPDSDTELYVLGSLPILTGAIDDVGFGVNHMALFRFNPGSNFYWGYDVGLHFWGEPAVQVSPTVQWRFTPHASGLVPYFGLSMGPYLFLGGDYASSLIIAGRPGVELALSHKMTLIGEFRFGQIGGVLLLQPTLGVSFHL
jgi:hypothetical protein